MAKSKYTTMICVVLTLCMLLGTVTWMMYAVQGNSSASTGTNLPYATKLFATDIVHTLDIQIAQEDWQEILDNPLDKTYMACDIILDGETVQQVALRTKGNSTLSTVASSESDRYSFKLEFDHFVDGQSYYGLDKLALNNIAQDNTYLKDYLSYQMMQSFGADSPLCSFIYITVNGEDWGLYLAVEGIEDSFLQRSYGNTGGQLYKPDSMDMVDGGQDRANDKMPSGEFSAGEMPDMGELPSGFGGEMPDMGDPPDAFGGFGQMPPDISSENSTAEATTDASGNRPGTTNDASQEDSTQPAQPGRGNGGGMMGGGMGGNSTDVALVYTDDDHDSYRNIFDNAKTDPSSADKDRLIASLKQLNEGKNLSEVIDINEVLRYFVVHNFVLNFDSYTGSMMHNYYLYEQDGVLSMIAWDYNLAFGSFGGMGGQRGSSGTDNATTMVNYPIDTPTSGTTLEDRPMLGQLLTNEEYLAQYHTLFAEFIAQLFETDAFTNLIDSAIALISPYVAKDPTAFCTYEEFEEASAVLREFCLLRAESVSGQLSGTIPATQDGQTTDSSSLVDASHLSTQIMGSNAMSFRNARGPEDTGGNSTQEERTGAQDESTSTQDDATTQVGQSSTTADAVVTFLAVNTQTDAAIGEVATTAQASDEVLDPFTADGTAPNMDGNRPQRPQDGAGAEEFTPPSGSASQPDTSQTENATTTQEGREDTGQTDSTSGQDDAQPPDNAQDGQANDRAAMRPDAMQDEVTSTGNTTIYLYLAAAILILLLGLLFAWKFRA